MHSAGIILMKKTPLFPGSAADTNSLAGRTVAPCSTGLPG